LLKKGKRISKGLSKKIRAANIKTIPMVDEMLEGKAVAEDVLDPVTGEVFLKCNDLLTAETIAGLVEKKSQK